MKIINRIFSSKKNVEKEIFNALYEANIEKLIELVASESININRYSKLNNSILIQSLLCKTELQGSEKQLKLVEYLISNKVDINWMSEEGYNALHVALEYHSLSKISLLLIKSENINTNIPEKKHGNTPIFTAIREFGKTWRPEQKSIYQSRLLIIEELLKRKGNLNSVNKHGISPRHWIKISNDEKLKTLIEKYK